MDDLKSFLVFIQLILNRDGKKVLFAWLEEYFRTHPLPADNSTTHDPLALLDSKEVCKLLKVNRHYLYAQIEASKIKVSRKGNALRFRRKDVQEYIDKEFNQNP